MPKSSLTVNDDMRTHMKALGIPVNVITVSWRDITKAYKKQAKICHPDKKSGSKAAFIQLSNAYNALETIFKKPVFSFATVFPFATGEGEDWDLFDPIPLEQRNVLNEMSEVLINILEQFGQNYCYTFYQYFKKTKLDSTAVLSINAAESSSVEGAANTTKESRNHVFRAQFETRTRTRKRVVSGTGILDRLDHAEFLEYKDRNQYYMVTIDDPALKSMVEPAMQHLNQFATVQDIKQLKQGMKAVFDSTHYKNYKPFFTQIYDVFIQIIRTLFRVLDYLVTFVSRRDKLMADTYTPGAQSIVNRSHFFNYSTVPPKPSKKLEKLQEEFDEKLNKLENLLSFSAVKSAQISF
ncbi:MAG: DnaJ domain-containing protein [Legionellaceae bacterium]|nr:DnaJ domain-containing protein [Legionellaceae bacterium]